MYTYGGLGSVANGTGFDINFTVNALSGNRVEWYWYDGVKRFVVVLEFVKGSEHAWAWLYLAQKSCVFGQFSEAHFGSQSVLASTHPEFNGGQYNLRIYRNGTTAVCGVGIEDNGWSSTMMATWNIWWEEGYSVSADFWNDPTVNLDVYHDGVGSVDVSFGDSTVGAMGSGSTQAVDNSPSWLQGIADFINVFLNFGSMLFGMLVAIGEALLPVAPWFFVAYLADAVIASVAESSVQPVGVFFRTLFSMIQQAGSLVYGFAQVIADAIPL